MFFFVASIEYSNPPEIQVRVRCGEEVLEELLKLSGGLETPKGAYLTMGCTIWIIFGCVPVMTMVVLHENSK